MAMQDQMPKFHELMNPLLQALRDLGGLGSVDEIFTRVSEILKLHDDILSTPNDLEKSSQTEVEYRLAWARTYLKKYGLLDNSARGVWVILADKKDVVKVDPRAVIRKVQELRHLDKKDRPAKTGPDNEEEELQDGAEPWRSQLFQVLTQKMEADGFERLVKRMLRESGFVQVEVTGRSGDGGIDGKGILSIGGILSFHVLIKCKKYQRSVAASAIRDFRGSLVGRADKGLFVTTGAFTRDAIKEATRDGAPPIDLMDGSQLSDKLKELKLGLKIELVESVTVDAE